MPIGAALGIAAAVGVGFAIYCGGVKLEPAPLLPLDRRVHHCSSPRVCSPARCARFTKPGSGTACRGPPSTSAHALPQDGVLGTLLAGVFGYQDAPTIGEVFVYFAFLVPAAGAVLRAPRAAASRAAALRDLSCVTGSARKMGCACPTIAVFRDRAPFRAAAVVAAPGAASQATPACAGADPDHRHQRGLRPGHGRVAAGQEDVQHQERQPARARVGNPQGRRWWSRSARTSCRASRRR